MKAAFLGSLALAALAAAQNSADLITNLPGAPAALNFSQYAGYLTVDQSHGRKLFYWYAESQGDPSSDPVVLWLNGGPGCSSLSGMFTENGPYIVQSDSATLALNPTSWNRIANMLWLEAPAAVGFSYSNTPSDYNTNDVQTASDNLAAIVAFFASAPQLAGRPFFITGESYAGHYIPELAAEIINYNAGVPAASRINLAGIAVGNGLTDELIDFTSPPYYYANHALVSPYTWDSTYEACGNGTYFAACSGYVVDATCPTACSNWLNNLANEVGNINPYDILGDLCLSSSSSSKQAPKRRSTAASILAKHSPFLQRVAAVKGWKLDDPSDDPFGPCIDDYVTAYLNRADVKTAIHANPSITWEECNQQTLNYEFNHSSMLPIYQWFADAAPSMHVHIYSGDLDSVLPFLGTEWNVQALGRTVMSPWTQWFNSAGQPAGYTQAFSHSAQANLTFTTVRGAGHMVPGTQAVSALTMLESVITNTPLPSQ